jgi:hypothetical protein
MLVRQVSFWLVLQCSAVEALKPSGTMDPDALVTNAHWTSLQHDWTEYLSTPTFTAAASLYSDNCKVPLLLMCCSFPVFTLATA